MGELGSGGGSSYPGTLDTDTVKEVDSPAAGKTKARADVPNDMGAAIVAIETELGTDPAGTKTDVKTYLQTEHTTSGTHGVASMTFPTAAAGTAVVTNLNADLVDGYHASTTGAASCTPVFSSNGNMNFNSASYASANRSTAQSISNASVTTIIFDTENTDRLSEYNNGTGVFTATEAGLYCVSAQIQFAAQATAAGVRRLYIKFNGTELVQDNKVMDAAYNSLAVPLHASCTAYLGAGQTIRVDSYQTSGGALNIDPTGTTVTIIIAKVA